jgi:hypothetical protein
MWRPRDRLARKWWSTGVGQPDYRLLVFMGLTDPAAPRHAQHTMVLVPRDTPGVSVQRLLPTMGRRDEPFGHGEVTFSDVRVPAANILAGPGRVFEAAQSRLGPGRVHHCMRLVGLAERCLELACTRATSRTAFGKPLANLGGRPVFGYVPQTIAFCDDASVIGSDFYVMQRLEGTILRADPPDGFELSGQEFLLRDACPQRELVVRSSCVSGLTEAGEGGQRLSVGQVQRMRRLTRIDEGEVLSALLAVVALRHPPCLVGVLGLFLITHAHTVAYQADQRGILHQCVPKPATALDVRSLQGLPHRPAAGGDRDGRHP